MLGEPGLNLLFSILELNYKFEHTLIIVMYFFISIWPQFILFLFLDTKYI